MQVCIGFIGIFVVLVLRKVCAHNFVTKRCTICKSQQHLICTDSLAVCQVVYQSICMPSRPCILIDAQVLKLAVGSTLMSCLFLYFCQEANVVHPRRYQCSLYLQAMIIDFKLPWPSPTAGMVHATASSLLPNPCQKATSVICPLFLNDILH